MPDRAGKRYFPQQAASHMRALLMNRLGSFDLRGQLLDGRFLRIR
jgi:hypothetical protein